MSINNRPNYFAHIVKMMRRLLLIVLCVLSVLSCNQNDDLVKDILHFNVEVNRNDMNGIRDILRNYLVMEKERKYLKIMFDQAINLDSDTRRLDDQYEVKYLSKPSDVGINIFYHFHDNKKLVLCINGHKDFILFLANEIKNKYSVRFLTDEKIKKIIYRKKDSGRR